MSDLRFRARALTTERAAACIVFLLLFAMASRVPLDPDMWWHLRVGQRILSTGEAVYADPFSHTQAGVTHKNHSGLAQIVMAGMWSLGGYPAMTLFVSALALGGMFCLYLAGRGSIYLQGFTLVFGAACAAAFWSPRPQMFTFVFAAVLLLLLSEVKRGRRDRRWLLPPLMWLWANAHGGYFVGYIFIAAFVVGETLNRIVGVDAAAMPWRQIRLLAAFALFSLVLLPIHPLGFDVFRAPLETLGISELRSHIQEWKPLDLTEPAAWGFLVLLTMLIAALAATWRQVDFTEFLLVGGTLLMALVSARHLSLFALAAVPVVTTRVDLLLRRKGWVIPRRSLESPKRSLLNLLLIVTVALGTLARFQYVSDAATVNELAALNFPAGALAQLDALAAGNLFNSYNWGGYLIYHAPQVPVFIDGRTDLHRDLLADYAAAAAGEQSWRALFSRWHIAQALIETGGGLAAQLATAADWRLEYSDDLASLFRRLPAELGADSS